MCNLMNRSLKTPLQKPSRPWVPLVKLLNPAIVTSMSLMPGVVASDLAAMLATHDVIQVKGKMNAPLVTIALDEAALVSAVLLLGYHI